MPMNCGFGHRRPGYGFAGPADRGVVGPHNTGAEGGRMSDLDDVEFDDVVTVTGPNLGSMNAEHSRFL